MKPTEIVELPPIDPNQRYTIAESAIYLRQSISKTYLDAQSGALKTFKDGRRTYVPGTALIERSRA